jgi:CheY-like chemotaxis protein
VDDHRQVLESVSAMLSNDFDVAGIATSGAEAIDVARELHPDVIVLDVDMPGLDGFQTLRALEREGMGSTPVVFLSMHDTDEIVSEAFRSGGRGYVLKTRVGRDLVNALDQARFGRLFVPSLEALSQLADNGGHAMQIHNGGEAFIEGVTAFFDRALRRGEATCVIATSDIREGLANGLRGRGWDVGGAAGHNRYLAIDAGDALHQIMRDGLPDPDRIAEIVAELDDYRRTVTEGSASRLILFGNAVMSLSADRNPRALLAVESHWNRLTQGLPFLTLCAYTSSCFHDGEPDLWSDACNEHWVLSHAGDV